MNRPGEVERALPKSHHRTMGVAELKVVIDEIE